MISRRVSPTSLAAWNMVGTSRMVGSRPSRLGALARSSSRLTRACVVARLPAVSSVMTRSPSVVHVNIFRNMEMLSTPALVRVSDMNTRPRFIRSPTQ